MLSFEELTDELRHGSRKLNRDHLNSERVARLFIFQNLFTYLEQLNQRHGLMLNFTALSDDTRLRDLCHDFTAEEIRSVMDYIKTSNATLAHLTNNTIMELRFTKDIMKLTSLYLRNQLN